jgi:hypothetical protein
MQDRRKGEDRRVENLPVEVDRREEDRRELDRSRRQVMDRRVQSMPIENDRRKGSRRTAEKEAASRGEEAVPDWMDSVLAEAAQRSETSPAMSPPPVDERENNYFNRSEEEVKKQEQIWDLLIMGFVICCFIGLIAVLVYGV